jgi:hypothetical protein
LISSNQRSKYSDRLYYDQYRYCFRVVLLYVDTIGQQLDHQRIDKLVQLRENLGHYARKVNFGGTWREREANPSQHDIDNLHTLCDFFISNKSSIKLQFFKNKCFIYTNNLELSEQLDQLGMFEEVRVNEVDLSRPRNTVKSRYPGYQLRIYFKPITVTLQERQNIIKFIDNNDYAIKMNVGMERFYNVNQTRGRYLTLRDYYFIDLKDNRLASMLELACPGVIRKTMEIIYDDK